MPAGPAETLDTAPTPASTAASTPSAAPTARPWHVGAGWSTTKALLTFGDAGNVVLTQQQVVVWLARAVGDWTVRGIVGGQFNGKLDATVFSSGFSPGWVLGASAGKSFLRQDGVRPYVHLSGALAVSSMGRTNGRLTAMDLRVGADAGWQLARDFDLHATARLFGGPVLWQSGNGIDTGTDRRHYQLGVGAGWRLSDDWRVFGEWIASGETGGSAGLSTRW